jgi:hypothetical protein
MKTKVTLVASCVGVALLGGSALAQNESTNLNQNPSLQQANAQEFFKASDLIGKSTQDNKGNKVGSIKEIAFNQQGQVFAFVDVGGGKWAAVPWQVVQSNTAKGRGNVVLNATEQQMKSGPAVTKDQWGSLNNPKFVEGCYSYYNVQSSMATGGATTPGGTSQGQGQIQQQQQSSPPQQ